MKSIVKNGEKFIINESLYKRLVENGDIKNKQPYLSANPMSATYNQSNTPNVTFNADNINNGDEQNTQEPNEQEQNVKDSNEQEKSDTNQLNQKQKQLFDTEIRGIKSRLSTYLKVLHPRNNKDYSSMMIVKPVLDEIDNSVSKIENYVCNIINNENYDKIKPTMSDSEKLVYLTREGTVKHLMDVIGVDYTNIDDDYINKLKKEDKLDTIPQSDFVKNTILKSPEMEIEEVINFIKKFETVLKQSIYNDEKYDEYGANLNLVNNTDNDTLTDLLKEINSAISRYKPENNIEKTILNTFEKISKTLISYEFFIRDSVRKKIPSYNSLERVINSHKEKLILEFNKYNGHRKEFDAMIKTVKIEHANFNNEEFCKITDEFIKDVVNRKNKSFKGGSVESLIMDYSAKALRLDFNLFNSPAPSVKLIDKNELQENKKHTSMYKLCEADEKISNEEILERLYKLLKIFAWFSNKYTSEITKKLDKLEGSIDIKIASIKDTMSNFDNMDDNNEHIESLIDTVISLFTAFNRVYETMEEIYIGNYPIKTIITHLLEWCIYEISFVSNKIREEGNKKSLNSSNDKMGLIVENIQNFVHIMGRYPTIDDREDYIETYKGLQDRIDEINEFKKFFIREAYRLKYTNNFDYMIKDPKRVPIEAEEYILSNIDKQNENILIRKIFAYKYLYEAMEIASKMKSQSDNKEEDRRLFGDKNTYNLWKKMILKIVDKSMPINDASVKKLFPEIYQCSTSVNSNKLANIFQTSKKFDNLYDFKRLFYDDLFFDVQPILIFKKNDKNDFVGAFYIYDTTDVLRWIKKTLSGKRLKKPGFLKDRY